MASERLLFVKLGDGDYKEPIGLDFCHMRPSHFLLELANHAMFKDLSDVKNLHACNVYGVIHEGEGLPIDEEEKAAVMISPLATITSFTSSNVVFVRVTLPAAAGQYDAPLSGTKSVTSATQLADLMRTHPSPLGVDLKSVLDVKLDFRIPTGIVTLARRYPESFELQTNPVDYDPEIACWLSHTIASSSVTAVSSLDSMWLNFIFKVLRGELVIYQNQTDPSSKMRIRPDFIVMFRSMLMLRGEAKFTENEMNTEGVKQIKSGFHSTAFKLFPRGSFSTFGITTCATAVKVFVIRYNHLTKNYITTQAKFYDVMKDEEDRVQFIIDLVKVMRFFMAFDGPQQSFHLIPSHYVKTTNGHRIVWTDCGIIKKFEASDEAFLVKMKAVYDLRLPHIEWGDLQSDRSILIVRVGRRLIDALRNGEVGVAKAIADIKLGVEELHGKAGMAHCDLCVENVFYDEHNDTVFLGDLEYLTPIYDPPPGVRRSHGDPTTAIELDKLQLQSLIEKLVCRATGE